jgi:hypothetical protein
VGQWLEEGLVDGDLGVWVDGVVADVQKLINLGFRKLFNNAFAGFLVLNQLTWYLDIGKCGGWGTYFLHFGNLNGFRSLLLNFN